MYRSRAVNLKHRFNHKDQVGFPMPCKEGHLLVDGLKIEDIEYPFEYPFTPSHYKDTDVLPNTVAKEEGNHEANGDLKIVTEFNGCDRRKLRMQAGHL